MTTITRRFCGRMNGREKCERNFHIKEGLACNICSSFFCQLLFSQCFLVIIKQQTSRNHPKLHATIQNLPKPSECTCNHPETIQNHPETTRIYSLSVATTTENHLKPTATTKNHFQPPKPPATNQNHPQPTKIIYNHLYPVT